MFLHVQDARCQVHGTVRIQRPTSDFCCSKPNKAPMSTRDCCVSRYTEPKKFSGIDTCNDRAPD